MAHEPAIYLRAYHRVRQQRQSELKTLQRQMTDYAPIPRLAMGVFALVLGAMFTLFLPPLGAVVSVVGLTMVFTAWRLWRQGRDIKKILADENFRWGLRDSALEKIGEKDFATLCRSVTGQGSYESLAGWLARKDLNEAEVNALILAAAVANEEVDGVVGALKRAKDQGYVPSGMDAMEFARQQHEAAFGGASEEGLHAQQLREAEAESRPSETLATEADEATDDIASVLEAARAKRRQQAELEG